MASTFAKLAATIGALKFFKDSVSEFADFESAMLRVQALSGATGADFDALTEKAKELGSNTKYTAVEAAGGLSQLAAAGYNAQQMLDAIGPALHAAAAGGSDLEETADQLTNIMGAFGLAADQAGRVADVLTQGFTGAATTMSQLAYAMKPAGAIAKALGYSLEETVAILQSLANVGFKGEQAGTVLRNAMAAFLDENAVKKMKELGVEVTDTEGKVRKLADILDDMAAAGFGAKEMLDIFGAEAGPGMQAILGQGAQAIRDYEQALLSAGGRAQQVSDRTESGLKGALNRLSASWKELQSSFGKAIAPAVGQLADALAGLNGWFAKMPDWVKQALALATAFATVAGAYGAAKGIIVAACTQITIATVAMVGRIRAAFALLMTNPWAAALTAVLGVAVVAWRTFGKSALSASKDHARAAAEIGKSISATRKQVDELRDLQKTLLDSSKSADEHRNAEERLAQVLPEANLRIDEQGRVLAKLTDAADANNKKLNELIETKERESRIQMALQLEQQARSLIKAEMALNGYNRTMQEGYGLNSDNKNNIQQFVLWLDRQSGAFDRLVAKGAKFRDNLHEQKTAFEGYLQSLAKSGTTVGQLNDILITIDLDQNAKNRIISDYSKILNQLKHDSQKANADINANAARARDEQVGDAKITAKELSQIYKSYVNEVRSLQEQISGRQKSLNAELRDMARGGMNDADAWVDQRNAAKEYIKLAKQAADEARRAQAGGDTITAAARWKEAVAYADDARAAYKALNHEVKIGDQVVISSQTALKGAMRGVKEAGELGIAFLKEQEKAAANAAREMEKHTSMADLTSEMDSAEKKWIEGWRRMSAAAEEAGKQVYNVWQNAAGFWTNVQDEFSAGWSKTTDAFSKGWDTAFGQFVAEAQAAARQVERILDQATKARTVKINVQSTQGYRWGGLIGNALRYATGGKLPGYGGGDRIPAVLESGEYIIRKEAVRKFGTRIFDALNHLHMPDISALTLSPAFAAPSRTVNINLSLGGETFPMHTDERTAAKIERWYALRSSNRITRNDYR